MKPYPSMACPKCGRVTKYKPGSGQFFGHNTPQGQWCGWYEVPKGKEL